MLRRLLLWSGYLLNWQGCKLAQGKLIQRLLLILLEDRDATKRPDTIRDYIHDVSLSIIKFIFMDVEVEIEHVDEGICHKPHLLASAIKRHPVEYGLLFVAVEVEFGSESHSCMQDSLSIVLCDSCAIFSHYFLSGF
jgi:hypothetical protein